MRLRRHLILCAFLCVVASLGGAMAASASVKHHKRHRRHRRHHHHAVAHKASVLPYMGPTPSPSIFSINAYGYVSSQSNFNRMIPVAHSMGSRWIHLTNAGIHWTNGQPDWNLLDTQVTQAKKLGMGVLISLGGSPNACSVARSNWYGCPPTTPGDLYAYSLFLRSELVRYHNVVQYWESWLEPNGSGTWPPGANPQQYANLLKTQYQVFQQVNSTYHTDLKLLFGGPISFGTAPGSPGAIAVLPFVDDVLNDLQGAHVFDGIALHAYRFPNPANGPASENWGPDARLWDYVGGLSFPAEGCTSAWCTMTWSQELRAFEQEFANHGYGQMPLWLTEWGWPGNANASSALYPSFDTQAQYLREAYDDILGLPFVQAAFVYNLEDYTPGIVSRDPAYFYHYGLLQYGFGQKPASGVYEQFVRAYPGR